MESLDEMVFSYTANQTEWHVDRRNVTVGDVCMLKDLNTHRGEWRICKVTNVFPENSDKVSNLEVTITPKQIGIGPVFCSKAN